MEIKVELKDEIQYCVNFNNIVSKYNLTTLPLFRDNTKLFLLLNTDIESRRKLKECDDIKELIVNRESDYPIK